MDHFSRQVLTRLLRGTVAKIDTKRHEEHCIDRAFSTWAIILRSKSNNEIRLLACRIGDNPLPRRQAREISYYCSGWRRPSEVDRQVRVKQRFPTTVPVVRLNKTVVGHRSARLSIPRNILQGHESGRVTLDFRKIRYVHHYPRHSKSVQYICQCIATSAIDSGPDPGSCSHRQAPRLRECG